MAEKRLYDLAKVIRSKNSGPFSITCKSLLWDKEKRCDNEREDCGDLSIKTADDHAVGIF